MDICLPFQSLFVYKRIIVQASINTKINTQIHAFLLFLKIKYHRAKLPNIAFLKIQWKHDENWCPTCSIIINKLVPNLKSTCTKLKIRNHFVFFKLVQTAIAIEIGVWFDSL